MQHISSRRVRTLAVAITLSAGVGFGLTACADDPVGQSSSASEIAATTAVTFDRAWGKATDGPMSGVFGTLTNHTDDDLTLESASSSAADLVELHETVSVDGQMLMREVEGGFVVPAGSSRDFVPGEDHIMLMELTEALLPGQLLPITLTFSDGTVLDLELDIREYAGANEEYADLEHGDHVEHGEAGDE